MVLSLSFVIKIIMSIPANKQSIQVIYREITQIIETARRLSVRAINSTMVRAYWNIGRIIVEEEQKGIERAEYGDLVICSLSGKLTEQYGKGFNERNLWYMRQFYLFFPNMNALRSELNWTHYRELLKIKNEAARNFYLHETINSQWSTRELERQINSLLYERLLLSKNQKKVRELSTRGQIIEKPEDAIKDPYVLEFLGLKENALYLERDIEKALIEKLKNFLLELGKGFSFVSRQKRITVDGEHYYIDLVFYNYLLNCFFLIDLKVEKLTHQDVGQMDFYVRYFEKEIKKQTDNPTIGLILCSAKNEIMIKYTLLSESKQIFASKYKLYLPTEKELKKLAK
jgi:predicted nuclease of restriction endonuclease-like (RecB) superfamily